MRRYDVTPWFSTKVQLQLAQEAGMSQGMADLEFKVRTTALDPQRPSPA